MFQLISVVGAVDHVGKTSIYVKRDESTPMKRTFNDFKRLSTEIERAGGNALQLKRLKNLCESNWEHEKEGWNHHMTKSVKIVNQWLVDAYLLAPQSAFFDEALYTEQVLRREKQTEHESYARRHQQYFMSAENMARMLELTSSIHLKGATIIEPSCGDGRLLEQLATVGNHIVGCDIDIVALTRARELTVNHSNISTIHSDFLLTTKQDFLSSAGKDDATPLIAIGGPPYTAGGGTGQVDKNTGRELPYQFISHCANTLHCNVILFLLPVRFCKAEAIAQVAEDIGAIDLIENEFADVECRNMEARWTLQLLRPVNDRFDFVDRSVVQPVVFFLLAKKEAK